MSNIRCRLMICIFSELSQFFLNSLFCSVNCSAIANACLCARVFVQVKNLSLRLEQEIHKRGLSQSELKMQNQQVSVLRSSEKQLKQELNHLLDMKQVLEKQNQELRRSSSYTQ